MCLYLLLNSCTFGIHIRKWCNYLNTIYCVNCVKQVELFLLFHLIFTWTISAQLQATLVLRNTQEAHCKIIYVMLMIYVLLACPNALEYTTIVKHIFELCYQSSNYFIMMLNHFLYVSKTTPLKLRCFGMIISTKNNYLDLKKEKRKRLC